MAINSRNIPLNSVFNVRDVGGLKTTSANTLNRKKLIRGAAPDRISQADFSTLTDTHDVETFLDLRFPFNFEAASNSVIATSGYSRINVSVMNYGDGAGLVTSLENDIPYNHVNAAMSLLERPDRVSQVMELVGEPKTNGLYMHCATGKDRTGLLVGMILSTLGVDAEDVAADYHDSDEQIEEMFEAIVGESERLGKFITTVSEKTLTSVKYSPKQHMIKMLDAIDERFGSSRQYLLDLPNGSEIVENLEQKFLG